MSDVMLLGILRMPPEIWNGSQLDVNQRHSRYIQAAERIEADAEKIASIQHQNDELKKRLDELHREYMYLRMKLKPLHLHVDEVGVVKLAAAMCEKLDRKRRSGKRGWDSPDECSTQLLSDLLVEHLSKGDYVDIANFCMMLFNRGAGKDEIQQSLKHIEAAAVEKAVEEVTKMARDNGFWTLDPDDFKSYIAELRQQSTNGSDWDE